MPPITRASQRNESEKSFAVTGCTAAPAPGAYPLAIEQRMMEKDETMTQDKKQTPARIADEQLDAVTGGAFLGGVRVATGDVNGDGVAGSDVTGDGIAAAPKKTQLKSVPASGKLGG